jgi:hypothetical protein
VFLHRTALLFTSKRCSLWSRAAAAGTAGNPAKLDTGHGCPFLGWLSSSSSGSHEERENGVSLKSSHDEREGEREKEKLAISRFTPLTHTQLVAIHPFISKRVRLQTSCRCM